MVLKQNLKNQILIDVKNQLCIKLLRTVDNNLINHVYNNFNDNEIIDIILDYTHYITESRNCVYNIVSENVMNIVKNNINNNLLNNIHIDLKKQSISSHSKKSIINSLYS